jgi:hypothetical protein
MDGVQECSEGTACTIVADLYSYSFSTASLALAEQLKR